jgi:DNA primase
MPHYENDYQNIKDKIDLLGLITKETGLAMKGHHLAECPFCHGHECFSIQANEGRYKCFQCEAGGDIFTFLESYHQLDKSEALKKAAEISGVVLRRSSQDIKLTTKERIFIESADYYHSHFNSNGGQDYFIKARKHGEDILRKMKIGWTDGGLIEHLRGKGFTDLEIKKSGLAKDKSKDGQTFLGDYFSKNLAIFPHIEGKRVLHFTMKDPAKALKYQLTNENRSKDWRFYNQGALEKYNEIIVVEGENDLLSVMDAGVDHVIGLIGQPSEQQIKSLKTHCVNKHIYLWLDNDEAGEKYIRQISKAVQGTHNLRVITYLPDFKDPDDYIQKFTGVRKKEIKRLQVESISYVSWEILKISGLENLELRLKALKNREVFSVVANMVEAEKLVYIEKLQSLGLSKKAIEEELEANQELKHELQVYFEMLTNKRDADPNHIASLIYRHLGINGRFFYDRMNDVYLMYQHHIYEIANNRPFNALIKKTTGILPTKEPGRSVWESLASEAYNSGKRIDLASWIHTDRVKDTIYVNLNSPNNILFKISTESIEEIQNGLNKEGVLLKSSRKILPVNFLPDGDIREGMIALKELIFDNLTCDKEQRYLILCWLISAFFVDFSPYMGLMKFSGPTSSGKTTAARLISMLIYGNEHLGDPSTAAAYAVASQNPLLIIDNLESSDVTKSILKFLLLSATKGGKEKRTQGTETETIEEMPKALVLITAIEPFTQAELINRTYDIEFLFKHKSDDFVEDDMIRELVKKRDLIITSILKFIQKDILPNLDRRKEYITILKKEFRNHSKNRTDEYLALLMLMLEKLLKYISFYGPEDFLYGVETGEKEIRKAWIDYQDAKAKETETSSNTIIKLLDGLVREYLSKMKDIQPEHHPDYEDDVFVYSHPEYLLELVKTKPELVEEGDSAYTVTHLNFVADSGDIVAAFDRFCRNNGLKNPYEKASVFGSRLNNDRHLLKKGYWELVSKERCTPYYRIIDGRRFWKFRKTLVR